MSDLKKIFDLLNVMLENRNTNTFAANRLANLRRDLWVNVENYPPREILNYFDEKNEKLLKVEIKVGVAGLSKDDVEVTLKDNKILTIKTVNKKEEQQNTTNLPVIYHSTFAKRSFTLEYNIEEFDIENVELKDGILKVSLLHNKKEDNLKKIDIL